MKIFIRFITFFFILFGFSSSFVMAQGGIFDSEVDVVPYCGDGECGIQKGIEEVKNGLDSTIKTDGDAAEYIQEIVANILYYLYLITVLIIIYAGFVILTAGGEEEKVTKGKKIIMFALIGLVVIFLAGPLTDFIFSLFDSGT